MTEKLILTDRFSTYVIGWILLVYQEMFSTVLLGVDVSHKMLSFTVLLDEDGTSVLCTLDSCCSCWFILSFGEVNRTLYHTYGRLDVSVFLLRVGLLTLYVDGFLYSSCKVMPLPTYYAKVFH